MTKAPFSILAVLLTTVSAIAMAQTVDLTDKDIIEKYCLGTDPDKGSLVNTNGKTTLVCKSENVRYLFEKVNAKLGIGNKDALVNKPYITQPEAWKKLLIENLFEQAKNYKDMRCSKIDAQRGIPVFRCKPKDIILTDELLLGPNMSFQKHYNEGLKRFDEDPNKTELGPYLVAKDTNPSLPSALASAANIKSYFMMPDQSPKLLGFDNIVKLNYTPGYFSPRFWMNRTPTEALKFDIKPMSYRDMANTSDTLFKMRQGIGMAAGLTVVAAAVDAAKVAPTETETVVTVTNHEAQAAPVSETVPTVETVDPVVVAPVETKPEEKVVETEPETDNKTSCKDELSLALSKVLEDDKQNIIGQQYELTVMKMAAIALGENRVTLEGLVRKQSDKIAKIDNGIIEKMNQVYKNYGLPQDAKAISKHLKEKANKALYYPKDKRFFNEDSSAFLLAYQSMNSASGIKDTDVSVLWFMDKVSKKAQSGSKGKYSSVANRTNLSTRIAKYTGFAGGSKGFSKEELTALADEKKKELDAELSSVVADFKEKNAACYKELFTEGGAACDLTVIEGTLSQLLAVQSKIPSTELISLDDDLKGGFDKTRFQIVNFAKKD